MVKSYKIGAVIYIGSYSIYLKIAEVKNKKQKTLEYMEYPLALGKDTFVKGKIGFDRVELMCDILSNYLKIINEYEVTKVKVFSTTALREAKNKDYILDQIKVKTGLDVDIIDDSEEKLLIYREVSKKIKNVEEYEKDDVLIAYIGTGSVGIGIYSKGHIRTTHSLRLGSMKISELFSEIQEESDDFYIIVDEYLNGYVYMIEKLLPVGKVKHFIATGREIQIIAQYCKSTRDEEFIQISRKDFDEFYEFIKNKTIRQIMDIYDISEDKAEVLMPAAAIYRSILQLTKADKIVASFALIIDDMMYNFLYHEETLAWEKVFNKNTILNARDISKRYMYNEKHAERVEMFAVDIFDKLKKLHGLGSRERLLLQVAAIMHDVGKYINIKTHYDHSFTIIKSSDIVGINLQEQDIVANIARYHSTQIPTMEHRNFRTLSAHDRVLVSKLTAILRIADSLERAHVQKFEELDIKLKKDILEIVVDTDQSILLEEWTFKKKAEFFEEVFGIRPVIKKKRGI